MNPVTFTATQITPLAIAVSITIGMTELIKKADQDLMLARFYPLISFGLGIAISMLVFHLDFAVALVTALAASGTYDVVRRTVLNKPSSTKKPTLTSPNGLEPPSMGETATITHPAPSVTEHTSQSIG